MTQIKIANGSYRNKPVINQTFTLVSGFKTGKKGGYVTVKNEGHFAVDISDVKIKVDGIDQFKFLEGNTMQASNTVAFKQKAETEVEAMDRIASRFAVLDEMSKACINGQIRAMIVTGPPGVGKSHGVNLQMEKASMFDKITNSRTRFQIVKDRKSTRLNSSH